MGKKVSKFDMSEACGWVGMVLIHAATLPTSLGVILGYNDRLPPLSMVLMVWAGLFLFLVRALGRNDKLYIIVRKDISAGLQISQSVHAAFHFYKDNINNP